MSPDGESSRKNSTPPDGAASGTAPEAWLKREQRSAARPIRAATVLGLAGGALVIVQAWLMADITDRVIFTEAALPALYPAIGALALVFLLRGVAAGARSLAGSAAARGVQARIRRRLFEHLASLGPVAVQREQSGEVAAAAVEGTEALEPYFSRYLPQRAVSVLVPLAVLAAIVPFDWIGGLILGATAFFVPVTMILIGRGAEELNQRQWRRLTLLSNRLLDAVQGLSTTKLFGGVAREAELIERMSSQYREATMRVLKTAFLSSLMLELLSTVSIATMAVSIGLRLLDAELLFRSGYAVLLLAPEFYAPLRRLGTDYHARMDAIGAAEQLLRVLESAPEPVGAHASQAGTAVGGRSASGGRAAAPTGPTFDVPGALRRPGGGASAAPSISVERASFAYGGAAAGGSEPTAEGSGTAAGGSGPAALDELTLEIPAGASIALVGPSGAGKTTLLRLLLGHIAPRSGEVRIDGTPLDQIEFNRWQGSVAFVQQRPYLFDATLKENILLGWEDRSKSQLESAVESAGLRSLVQRLERGLETRIGEAGASLSGGERQQVALARAFLKAAPVVLLDEPTAHLDMESEHRIQQAVNELTSGRTSIAVAHRLHTAIAADEILVMEKGRVVERGAHGELLRARGTYARLAGHVEAPE